MGKVYIHPTSEIDDTSVIGDGTKVWNQAQIRNDAVVGENCIISKNVYIDEHVRIGNRVKIQNNVNIYHGVVVEDDVFLGPSMTFTNDLYPRAFNNDWRITETLVKKGVSIGANATIVCGVTIGEYATVGSGSVVTKNIPAQALVVGNPAHQIGWVCKCGFRLDNEGQCAECKTRYDLRGFEN